MNRTAVLCTSIAGLILCGTAVITAGPLDPPAGPVAPTYKTLAEVEPRTPVSQATTPGDTDSVFRIDVPGSYYLTGNVTGVAGKSGIEIVVSNVTLDLNGFALVGVPGSREGINGPSTGVVNVAVSNGSLASWGTYGVDLATNTANIRLKHLTVRNCAQIGLRVGFNSVVSECSAFGCATGGIYASDGCTIAYCTARSCGVAGIRTSRNCTISHCAAHENSGIGIDAFSECVVTGCAAGANTGSGIVSVGDVVATGCQSSGNDGVGFSFSIGSVLTGCVASDNGSHGFAGSHANVIGCRADGNDGRGFDLDRNSTAKDCTALANGAEGIRVQSSCIVAGCHVVGNGIGSPVNACILANGADSRIEGNRCEAGDWGVRVLGAGNFIARNICTGNTIDWDFVANNVHGTIGDSRSPGSPAVFGFSAGGSHSSSDPLANYSY